jgi:hypothetical protein
VNRADIVRERNDPNSTDAEVIVIALMHHPSAGHGSRPKAAFRAFGVGS